MRPRVFSYKRQRVRGSIRISSDLRRPTNPARRRSHGQARTDGGVSPAAVSPDAFSAAFPNAVLPRVFSEAAFSDAAFPPVFFKAAFPPLRPTPFS